MNLTIGSRGSKLAVAQAVWVADELKKKTPGLKISFITITTTGDRNAKSSFQELGGKGVFVKEIEDALLQKQIDLAVHSLKDVPQSIPDGLRLGPYPRREDARDALISRFGEQLSELPRNSTIGTGSPRRQAQILHRYKKRSYRLEPIRGNVDTRLKKLQEGQYDAIVVAYAGLKRLGLDSEVSQVLEPSEILPAPGQGCLALELRSSDDDTLQLVKKISDPVSDVTARAERAFLHGLGGNCLVPVGVWCRLDGESLEMEAAILDVKGENEVRTKQKGPAKDPDLVGAQLAERLLYDGGSEILMAVENMPGTK